MSFVTYRLFIIIPGVTTLTICIPSVASKLAIPRAALATTFANFSTDGRVICRNFNRAKGCTLVECHFAHTCNRKVNGRACGQSHPSHLHQQVARFPSLGQGQAST